MLSPDMLEGLLRQTAVQWGTEQEVVVRWDTAQKGVVVLQEPDKRLGVAESMGLEVVECTGLGVAEGTQLGVAEGSTGGQHIVVQSGRQLLVEVHKHVEGGPDSNIEVFGPWIAAWGRLYFVYLTQ